MKSIVGRNSSRIINILCKDEDVLKSLKEFGIKKRRLSAAYASIAGSFLDEKYRLFSEELTPSFIKKCAIKQEERLTALGIDGNSLELMKTGETPKGFSVRHQIPLELGGQNNLENLILTATDFAQEPYQGFINWQISKIEESKPAAEDILIFQTLIFPQDGCFISLPPEKIPLTEPPEPKITPILIQKRDIRFTRYLNFFANSVFKNFFTLDISKITIPSLKSRRNIRKEYERDKKELNLELFNLNRKEIIQYFGRFSPELSEFEKGILPIGWTVHHILPISCGGSNELANLLIIHNSLHELMNDRIYTPQLDKFAVFGEEYEGHELSIAILKPKQSFCPLVIKKSEGIKRKKTPCIGFSLG